MATSSASSSRNTAAETIPTTLDGVLGAITTSQDDAALAHTLRAVGNGNADEREALFASFLAGGQDPLQVLDIQNNTVGILFILSARLLQQHPNVAKNYIREFISGFDPRSARLVADRVRLLGYGIVQAFRIANALDASLPLLYTLLERYTLGPSHLTPLHALIARTAVATRRFTDRRFRYLLSIPITEVLPPSESALDYNDALIYHYSGGIALGALKEWSAAAEFFEIVVNAPAQSPSAIQYEALKKLALVQLILHGSRQDLSKIANPSLFRMLRASPYGKFVTAYPSHPKELQKLLEKESIFAVDQNLGLARLALECASNWAVKRLTGTYITLSLEEIAASIGFADDEAVRKLLVKMIESGEVDGKIAADGTVSFEDSSAPITRADIERMLLAAQQQGLTLAELDRQMERNKEFLTKASKKSDDFWGGRDEDDVFRSDKTEFEESLF